jgi:uncharacterized protein
MKTVGVAVGAALGLAAYSFYEPFTFRLTTKDLPVAARCPELTILHLSDTHLQSRHHKLRAWLERLPTLLGTPPDLVLATGDMIEDDKGIDPLLTALAPLEARLGLFYVLGSHDYFQPAFKPYTKYLRPPEGRVNAAPADTARLEAGLRARGWISVSNSTHHIDSPHGCIRVAGVDDPFMHRHKTSHIERREEEVLALGLMHAPDVVSQFILAGFDLVVAGHTHGGQVRLPWFGALVTNCSLPRALAGGAHRIGHGWLHVSPGLGTGKYAPIRFACRPEATLLRLRPGDA